MAEDKEILDQVTQGEYKYGFVSDIESDAAPMGLSEDIVRFISAKKNEPTWLLDWRLKAYRHWLTMEEPNWQNIHYPKINYQDIICWPAGTGYAMADWLRTQGIEPPFMTWEERAAQNLE